LVSLARVAQATGRYFALLGRSLQNMAQAARVSGYWPEDLPWIEVSHLGYLPRQEVLAVATGSQGEPRAMLHRLAADRFYELSLEADDTVIFSSMIIPGNEIPIANLVASFRRRHINVIQTTDTDWPIHVSGHPCEAELSQMYQWIQPQIAIPVHGEPPHLQANAAIAKQQQIPKQLVGLNGDLYLLAPQVGIRRAVVTPGRIALVR
jgi:ribonuclease J